MSALAKARTYWRLGPANLARATHPVLLLNYTADQSTFPSTRDAWLGGFKKDGENFTTLDGLKAHLGPHFRLIDGPLEVPFVIRETRRKFQHTLSEVTVWERIA